MAGCNLVSDNAMQAVVESNPLRDVNVSGCNALCDESILALVDNCGSSLVRLSVSGLTLSGRLKNLIKEGTQLEYFVWKDGKQVNLAHLERIVVNQSGKNQWLPEGQTVIE